MQDIAIFGLFGPFSLNINEDENKKKGSQISKINKVKINMYKNINHPFSFPSDFFCAQITYSSLPCPSSIVI
jgi:hypothetical protein